MRKQNKDRNATRALMGIDALTGHSIETPIGELVFYIIQPTNIGVLPESSITARVRGLQGLLSGQTDWELMALNSRESFEANKSFSVSALFCGTLGQVAGALWSRLLLSSLGVMTPPHRFMGSVH